MFAGCEDDYKTDITIPMSGIYLSSPAEGATMDLNDESKDSYEFTWDKASEQGSVLIFSTTKDKLPYKQRQQKIAIYQHWLSTNYFPS